MKKLNESDFKNLVKGTSILSTGGGLPVQEMNRQYGLLVEQDKFPSLMSVEELQESDFVCSAYGVGSVADAENIDITSMAKIALEQFSTIVNKKIAALVPGEIGGETSALVLGAMLNIPVLDADLVGGRAVPNIEMDVFTLNDIPITPVVVVSSSGKTFSMLEDMPAYDIEKKVRKFVSENGKSGLLVGYGIGGGVAKEVLPNGTLSKSLRVGAGEKLTEAEKVCLGKVSNVSLESVNGFLVGTIEVSTQNEEVYSIQVKNEFISIEAGGVLVGSVPDSVLMINTKSKFGVHSNSVSLGMPVEILLLPRMDMWKSERGMELMGPKAFNIDAK